MPPTSLDELASLRLRVFAAEHTASNSPSAVRQLLRGGCAAGFDTDGSQRGVQSIPGRTFRARRLAPVRYSLSAALQSNHGTSNKEMTLYVGLAFRAEFSMRLWSLASAPFGGIG